MVLVAGFLGAGKTTLLNHLLGNNRGARIGVVMNDFGSIGVDAMSVAGQVDSMISLSNGCLCCAVDTRGLDAMLARLSQPKARIDVIVIEASGLAEPRELIRLMIASENPHIAYAGLVEVVDATEFAETRQRHPELDDHLRFADLIVLNKTDLASEPVRAELAATIRQLAPDTPVLSTARGRVDPAILFDHDGTTEPRTRARQLSFDDLRAEDPHDQHDCADGTHLHAAYDTVEFTSDKPMRPRGLLSFLETRPRGLYRMKGLVHFGLNGHRQKFGIHTVGGFLRFERSRWTPGESRRTQLVLIGADLDAEALRTDLARCTADNSAPTDDSGMLEILRYTDT